MSVIFCNFYPVLWDCAEETEDREFEFKSDKVPVCVFVLFLPPRGWRGMSLQKHYAPPPPPPPFPLREHPPHPPLPFSVRKHPLDMNWTFFHIQRLQGESNIPRVVSLRHSRCTTSNMAVSSIRCWWLNNATKLLNWQGLNARALISREEPGPTSDSPQPPINCADMLHSACGQCADSPE